jgi:hypothetical protein
MCGLWLSGTEPNFHKSRMELKAPDKPLQPIRYRSQLDSIVTLPFAVSPPRTP